MDYTNDDAMPKEPLESNPVLADGDTIIINGQPMVNPKTGEYVRVSNINDLAAEIVNNDGQTVASGLEALEVAEDMMDRQNLASDMQDVAEAKSQLREDEDELLGGRRRRRYSYKRRRRCRSHRRGRYSGYKSRRRSRYSSRYRSRRYY